MKYIFSFFIILIFSTTYCQDNSIFERLQVLKNTKNYISYYKVDGYTISSENMLFAFTDNMLDMAYFTYKVKEEEKLCDTILKYDNYIVRKTESKTKNINEYNSYYFLKDQNNKLQVIQFSVFNKKDENFERFFVEAVLENRIPERCYNDHILDSINFVSRKIKLECGCYYTNVNAVQCPYNGQISWSLHKDYLDAKNQIDNEFEVSKSYGLGEIIYDDYIDIVFEDIHTKARKITFDFTSDPDFVEATSNGEYLTVYYIADKIRNHYVSCILSHWNNDKKCDSGLPLLLDQVMKIN